MHEGFPTNIQIIMAKDNTTQPKIWICILFCINYSGPKYGHVTCYCAGFPRVMIMNSHISWIVCQLLTKLIFTLTVSPQFTYSRRQFQQLLRILFWMGSTKGLPANKHIKKSLGWLEKRLKKKWKTLVLMKNIFTWHFLVWMSDIFKITNSHFGE